MPWNPEKYNEFKAVRFQPFFDLVGMISEQALNHGVDIGCGTGEQTKILSERFPDAQFLGVDPSSEMLAKAESFGNERLHYKQSTVEEFLRQGKREWDLVFSNAALQWSDGHRQLFPDLIALVGDGGQFAIQMPVQKENVLNQLLIELVQEEPFVNYLDGWKRESPLLSMDEYAQMMFENGLTNIQVIQKVYPIIAKSPEELFDFISGTSLIPYMERFAPRQQEEFVAAYMARIIKTFKKFPAIYAFKRLLLYGIR